MDHLFVPSPTHPVTHSGNIPVGFAAALSLIRGRKGAKSEGCALCTVLVASSAAKLAALHSPL